MDKLGFTGGCRGAGVSMPHGAIANRVPTSLAVSGHGVGRLVPRGAMTTQTDYFVSCVDSVIWGFRFCFCYSVVWSSDISVRHSGEFILTIFVYSA